MNWLLRNIAQRLIKVGSLAITSPDGSTDRFGDGSGEHVHVAVRTKEAERAIALDPMLAVPERYMEGDFVILEGDLLTFLKIAFTNMQVGGYENALTKVVEGVQYSLRRLQQMNNAARSRENVRRHYDLSGELYDLFLDEDRQYSCAYFERPDVTIDEAQRAKRRHIAAKLALKPGQNVLDIGSGWGGLGLYLARQFNVDVLGVTLSTEQHSVSQQRALDEQLADQVHFEMRDYRDINERFDRIVSVGMFEHVGINHYRTFFDKASKLLKPDGVMLLHTIGRSGPPGYTNAFIRKYIFPGGYIPSLSEVSTEIERSGLAITDVEILRLHYAETLKQWRERFMANRDKAIALYDEKFARMWEFYLAGSEAAFRWSELVVFQIQLTHRNDVLPMTRDYISETERALAEQASAEATASAPKSAKKPERKSPAKPATRRKKVEPGE